jgi:hypothetical protein
MQPLVAFSVRRAAPDGRQSACKDCQAERDRANYVDNARRRRRIVESNERRRQRRTALLRDLKAAAGCADCGEDDPIVLEFDHLDAGTKSGDIATMAAGSWDALEAELAKCEVVCANCHRRRTHARRTARRDDQATTDLS